MFHMLGIVLGTGFIVMNKTDKFCVPMGIFLLIVDNWVTFYSQP